MSLGSETRSGMQGPCDFITLCEIQQRQPACGAVAEGVSCRPGPCSRGQGAESCLCSCGTYCSLAIPSIAAGTQSARQASPPHNTETRTNAFLSLPDCSHCILINDMHGIAAIPGVDSRHGVSSPDLAKADVENLSNGASAICGL